MTAALRAEWLKLRRTRSLLAVPADGRIDSTTGDDHANDDGFVDAADAARLQLLDQARLRLQRLGDYHQPRRVLVQTMHDAGARHIDQIRHMVQQCIEQRAIGMPCRGMHH